MSNLPDFSSWTGPASSGSVSESGGGNCEMSTFVPVEALAGIRLHPGPGPIGPGPGPSAARRGWSPADAATEKSAAASAANAMPPRHRADASLRATQDRCREVLMHDTWQVKSED